MDFLFESFKDLSTFSFCLIIQLVRRASPCWAMPLGRSVPLLLTCLTAENSDVPSSYVTTQDHVAACWLEHTTGDGAALCPWLRQSHPQTCGSSRYTTGQGLSRGCLSLSLSVKTAVERSGTLVALFWRVSCGRAWGPLVTFS